MGIWSMFRSWAQGAYADVSPTPPDDFHNQLWQTQATVYEEMWDYFNGDVFDETLPNRQDDLKYPLGVNLFATACANHRATLFGEYNDDVLTFRARSKNVDSPQVETALDRIWRASSRNSLLLEAGLLGMILGGVVFRVIWHPMRKRVFVRVVPADAFYPIWDPDDYHNVLECFIAYQTNGSTARRRFHVDVSDDQAVLVVQEHWTPHFIDVTVDGEEAYWDAGHRFPMSGPNPFKDPQTGRGIIPVEYFPRDRAGSFYGIPLGRDALKMQNNYNSAMADLGDAVLEATHQYKFLRGRARGTKGLERLTRNGLNDLGVPAPGQKEPDVFTVAGGEIPPGTIDWMDGLLVLARAAMHTPPVAYGQDEGSQRSALTLAFRMWPLSSAVRATRGFWADSFKALNRKALIVAANKGGYNVQERMCEYDTLPVWAPMLPRDREGEVNEVVTRRAQGLISTYTAIEKLEDRETEWVEEEVARIEDDAKKETELEIKIAKAGQQARQAQQNKPKPSSVPAS
ncbi:MAG: phage portal protein [Anaerolineae bacterium]|nr:phage portal protein [Anaerolineae bacterium]